MIVFLSLIYIALLALLVRFKIIKLTLGWKISPLIWMTALFVGLFMPMQFWAPAGKAVVAQYSVPIVPNVAGQVIEVSVLPNKPLLKGDLLFRLDSTPYQAAKDQVVAQLELAQIRLKDSQALLKTQAISESQVELYQAQVKQYTAALKSADYNLQQTNVLAPADGFATNLALRVGARVTNFPFSPVMAFVERDARVVALQMPQAYLRHIKPEQSIELTFKIFPGEIFSGKVESVVMASSQGQVSMSGNMTAPKALAAVPFVVRLLVDDQQLMSRLPAGALADVAVYTDQGASTHVIRKVMLRMTAWMNYVIPT